MFQKDIFMNKYGIALLSMLLLTGPVEAKNTYRFNVQKINNKSTVLKSAAIGGLTGGFLGWSCGEYFYIVWRQCDAPRALVRTSACAVVGSAIGVALNTLVRLPWCYELVAEEDEAKDDNDGDGVVVLTEDK
jgi:hypothetical protein